MWRIANELVFNIFFPLYFLFLTENKKQKKSRQKRKKKKKSDAGINYWLTCGYPGYARMATGCNPEFVSIDVAFEF